jgi:hypothetical protein
MNGAAIAAARKNSQNNTDNLEEPKIDDPFLHDRLASLISAVNQDELLQRIDKLDAILEEEEADRVFGLTSGVRTKPIYVFESLILA